MLCSGNFLVEYHNIIVIFCLIFYKKISLRFSFSSKQLYHYECPWPSAQAEVVCISAYKTPGDKLQCVVRASQTIMNLLSLAHEQSVPAADDFMPVLVYVLIKVGLIVFFVFLLILRQISIFGKFSFLSYYY